MTSRWLLEALEMETLDDDDNKQAANPTFRGQPPRKWIDQATISQNVSRFSGGVRTASRENRAAQVTPT